MTNHLQDAEAESSITEEVKLIPRWSIAVATLVFVFMQYLYWVILPAYRQSLHMRPVPAPLGVRFYFALSWSTLAALYVLMVGYVSRDAPRRNMTTRLWVVICLALPGGIGSVLYFLLRQPVVARCPSCGTSIHTEFHFCPQCAYQVSAACGNCYKGVRITDLYCVYCGHSLAADNAPSRLRAFHS
jgi:Double zinc ribbon/Phospholipase_D-nuclease N-terminal